MNKKPRKLGKKNKDFTAQIFKILSKETNKSFTYKQIAVILELDDTKSRNEIIRDLKILKAQDKIHEVEIGKYQMVSKAEYYEGTIDMTSRKTGYFICDELEDDVFIPRDHSFRRGKWAPAHGQISRMHKCLSKSSGAASKRELEVEDSMPL